MEAGQCLDLSIDDVVEKIWERAKGSGMGVKQSRQTHAMGVLVETVWNIISASKGKSLSEVNNNQEQEHCDLSNCHGFSYDCVQTISIIHNTDPDVHAVWADGRRQGGCSSCSLRYRMFIDSLNS